MILTCQFDKSTKSTNYCNIITQCDVKILCVQGLSGNLNATHQCATECHAGTVSGAGSHGGNKHIQNAKCGGGGQCNHNDLLNAQRLLGDQHGANRHSQAFNQVFDGTLQKLVHVKHFGHVEYILYSNKIIHSK